MKRPDRRLRSVETAQACLRAAAFAAAVAATFAVVQPSSVFAQAQPVVAEPAVRALIEQGNAWLARGRSDLAVQAFDRALIADPRNPSALAGLAQAQAQAGNRSGAEAALVRLRAIIGEASPEYRSAERAVRAISLDPAGLAEARRLSREGRLVDAVRLYQRLFGGAEPPIQYAVEYYLTLGGTSDGFEEARRGLTNLVARRPDDARLALALAQLLTYREETRLEGIAQLERLAMNPAVASEATGSWRRALTWAGPQISLIPSFERFLQRLPNDPEVRRLLAAARDTPPPPTTPVLARIAGFQELEAGRIEAAERRFQAALEGSPGDAEALAGLGLVRLRQGRHNEARDLLERAIRADPNNAERWQEARDGAAYAAALAEARDVARRGQAARAEEILRQALTLSVRDLSAARAQLGELLLARREAVQAEREFRAALEANPSYEPALLGLSQALAAQGRTAEAQEVARALPTRRPAPGAAAAEAVRREAQRAPDPATAATLLRRELLRSPNPWVALDLARILRQSGRAGEARDVMAPFQARAATDPDTAFALALFAETEGRPDEVVRLIEGIPASRRTAPMSALLRRASASGRIPQLAAELQGPRRAMVRGDLLRQAARSGPDGADAAIAVRAFGAAGDRASAEEAGRLGLVQVVSLEGRLAIAGALAAAGVGDLAASTARQIAASAQVTAEQRAEIARILEGAALSGAFAENARGDQAAAFERLRPILERDPEDRAANLALAQLFLSAGRAREAQRIAERFLDRDRRDVEARRLAMEAAVALGETRRANALLVEARQLHGGTAELDIIEARLAIARGDPAAAEAAVRRAGERRSGQVAGAPSVPTSTLPNPFRSLPSAGQPMLAGDPELARLQQEIARLRQDARPSVRAGLGLAGRSGSPGLDRMTAITGEIEGDLPLAGTGGSLFLRVEPTRLTSGNLPGNIVEPRRFGFNALNDPNLGFPPSRLGSDDAAGVGLAIGFRSALVRLDAGTTPLGFRRSNVVGGIEFAPELAPGTRLRLTAERRAVTDSILSWGGARDATTGAEWGAVTRTGGRAALEFTGASANSYVLAGYHLYQGRNVVDNRMIEVGAGVSFPIWQRDGAEARLGFEVNYIDFERNLRYFSFGHGGYFSPQNFFSAGIPVDYRVRGERVDWGVGATIGLATWRERSEPFYPRNPAQQSQLEVLAGSFGGPGVLETRHPGRTVFGATGQIRGDVEYRFTDSWSIGATGRFDISPNFQSGRALLFTRYRFD